MKNILLFCFLILLISCNSKNTTENKTDVSTDQNIVNLNDAQLQNANLEIGTFQKRNVSSTLKVSGKIDVPPQNLVSVSMPLGGYLKTTKLLPGMHVSKGEILATMEDQQ
jgi:cobalt-zinc-cadmium efflux system membrane fusion protein